MNDQGRGALTDIPPLPPFTTPEELLADRMSLLNPPSRISVTDAAERYMRVQVAGVWQRFDREFAPYTEEPADITQSRKFKTVCFVGSSQSGKTKMLETVAAHAIMCEPDPIMVVHMSRADRDAWVEDKLNPTIRNSPELADRLVETRGGDTFSRKRFMGMNLSLGYPVASQLSSRTLRKVLESDYDHMPQKLGPADSPEGSPYTMALQRIRSFMSRGCVMVESTPAFPVSQPGWVAPPETPHMMPPTTGGIVQIYNEGTRGRWYWECPDCDDVFEPRFGLLKYNAGLEPMAAGETAEMGCPHCGTLIAHRHKVELNRRARRNHGGWLHQGTKGVPVTIGDPDLRNTDVASYAMNGTVAVMQTWAELVSQFEKAMLKLQSLDDDQDLATWHYTNLGWPHEQAQIGGDDDLTLTDLKEMLQPATRGVAPAWARFAVITVDVQATRFPVQVTVFGLDGRRTVVDRFDLARPPENAPRAADRGLQPATYAEDWAVLEALSMRDIEIEGRDDCLRAIAIVVDYQGEAGVSDNAEKFWVGRRKAGEGKRWFLSRGHGGFHQRDRVWHVAPERSNVKGKGRSIKLLNIATDRLKDTVWKSLTKALDAAGAMILPSWMGERDEFLAEFLAEERGDKGWTKRQGIKRNESLDLSVQAQAIAEHKGLRKINPDAPPFWAQLNEGNPHFVRGDARASVEPEADLVSAEQQVEAKPTRSKGWLARDRKDTWL